LSEQFGAQAATLAGWLVFTQAATSDKHAIDEKTISLGMNAGTPGSWIDNFANNQARF
jgi:hypothetical protein